MDSRSDMVWREHLAFEHGDRDLLFCVMCRCVMWGLVMDEWMDGALEEQYWVSGLFVG